MPDEQTAGQKLRVLHLDHTTEAGGAELALRRMLTSGARDWEAGLAIPISSPPGVFDDLSQRGVAVHRVGGAQRPGAATTGLSGAIRFGFDLVRMSLALRRSSALREADVVHANSARSAVYGALALSGLRTPLVVHLRDRIEPSSLGQVGYRAFRATALRRATVFIANSHSTADTVESLTQPRQLIEVIASPTGVVTADAEAASAAHSGTRGRLRVVMVARLDPWKGQQDVIDAFALADLDDRADLVLVGDAAFGKDDYRDRLVERVREHGLLNVIFRGFVQDVQSEIDAADVCIQYSTRPEPLGQNVLQYLARRRPVIAAAEGGPTEWIADGVTGLLVEPRSPSSLAAALRSFADSTTLQDQLRRGARENTRLSSDEEIVALHGQAFLKAQALSRRRDDSGTR